MSTLSLPARDPAPVRHGLARIVAAVAAAFETVVDVIDEATDGSAAARNRFPTSD